MFGLAWGPASVTSWIDDVVRRVNVLEGLWFTRPAPAREAE